MENYNEQFKEIYKKVNELFDFINTNFFESVLSKPVLVISPDDKLKAHGFVTRGRVWQSSAGGDGDYEMTICSTSFNRPLLDIAETILHECCHIYARENGIQDCSRSGHYHNKAFASIASSHGLNVTKVDKIGYAKTDLTEESKKSLSQLF